MTVFCVGGKRIKEGSGSHEEAEADRETDDRKKDRQTNDTKTDRL